MAGPYLKSGESIILTTDRVLIEDVEYDLILTSQRLALVDSGHASDQPRVIPFATILSVKGGTTPAREPVITLTVIDPIGLEDSKTLDLVFSQQPYEDRSPECDTWVKKLIEHIVSAKEEPAPAERQQEPARSPGMNPTVRRWSAPEAPHPHMEVNRESRNSSDELLSAIQQRSWEEQETKPGGAIPPGDAPGPEAVEAAGNDEVPGVPETSGGEQEVPAGTGEPVPESAEESVPEMPDAAPAEAVGDERENEPVPEVPVPARDETAAVPADEGEPPAVPPLDDKQRLMAEEEQVLLGKETGAPPQPVAAETVPVIPAGPEVRSALPDAAVFPVLSGQDNGPEDTSPAAERPEGNPPAVPEGPARSSWKGSARGIAVLVIAVLVVACIGGVAFIALNLTGHNDGPDLGTVTPTPSLTPVQNPTATPIITPAAGVWVKVQYNGTFVGTYGNPGPNNQKQVRGTGEQFYAIKNSNDLVQASFTKLDYYGEVLTVEVYNNGTMIKQVKTSTPNGKISILVNSTTGNPPYVPVTTTAA